MTKQKGDISEQAVILDGLKRGWGVLRPIGDRLPYDLVFDVNGQLVRIQVKAAWFDKRTDNYIIDVRKCNTNRRRMFHSTYSNGDFDFAIANISDIGISYIFPSKIFISYGSNVYMIEEEGRQRKARSFQYREAWELIEKL